MPAIFNLLSLFCSRENMEEEEKKQKWGETRCNSVSCFGAKKKNLVSQDPSEVFARPFVVKLEQQVNIQDVMQCVETPVWRRAGIVLVSS